MLKFANGSAYSGLCADGKRHGHWLVRSANGTMGYHKYDDGTAQHEAVENINGTLSFDRQRCDATDARFMELRRLALDVAVGPAPRRTHPRAMPAHARRFVPAGSSRGGREQDRGAPPFQSATMHARRRHGLYEHGAAVSVDTGFGHARKHMCRPRLAACRPGVAPSFSFPCRRAHRLRTDFPALLDSALPFVCLFVCLRFALDGRATHNGLSPGCNLIVACPYPDAHRCTACHRARSHMRAFERTGASAVH
jgi:hypothetical protein